MKRRTVSADDLETMAFAAHERVYFPGPEGGWATATINGRFYRARVGAAAAPVDDGKFPGRTYGGGNGHAGPGNEIAALAEPETP